MMQTTLAVRRYTSAEIKPLLATRNDADGLINIPGPAHAHCGSRLPVIALATLAVLDLLLSLAVIRPVARLSTLADEISRSNMEVDELKITGRDEISTLAESFNRMHRSLLRAMQMLNQDPEV
jgi:HAMP domain-containing protein